MASITTTAGHEWISERMLGQQTGEYAYIVAVGNGSTVPEESDTSLDNELYRANDDDSNCTVELGGGAGVIRCRITISGGTEVGAGSDINEVGLFVSDGTTLIYREVVDTITMASGDRKTIQFELDIED